MQQSAESLRGMEQEPLYTCIYTPEKKWYRAMLLRHYRLGIVLPCIFIGLGLLSYACDGVLNALLRAAIQNPALQQQINTVYDLSPEQIQLFLAQRQSQTMPFPWIGLLMAIYAGVSLLQAAIAPNRMINRIKLLNNGTVPQSKLEFYDDGFNLTEAEAPMRRFSYGQVRKLLTSKRVFLLRMPEQIYIIVPREKLVAANATAFPAFIRERIRAAKKKVG